MRSERRNRLRPYGSFLALKQEEIHKSGSVVHHRSVNELLYPWQNRIVRWAVKTSRAAVWADTGLGKTLIQLEWARLSADTSLIVAPLAVCDQTVREAHNKLNINARYVKHADEVTGPGIWITNYERAQNFPAGLFDAVVLDESSILKQSEGKMRMGLTQQFSETPHRLACSATPAPNDPEELTTQAEWLGQMTRVNMLATYFVHDADGWRLKKHAHQPMIKWMSQWAVALTKPSDIGGDDSDYILPGLRIVPEIIPYHTHREIGGITGRSRMRRITKRSRVNRAVELVNEDFSDEPWILWCGLNAEADALADAIPDAVNVHGTLTPERKAELLRGFANDEYRVLITKPSIASQGLNYQHCARMAFVGLSDSWEQYYQAIRRCYRYGQKRIVTAHVIVSEPERNIAKNVARKEKQNDLFKSQLIEETQRRWRI